MASYNGHASRAAWNIALWIGNDEGLYRMARRCMASATSKAVAARMMLEQLHEMGLRETPDGYRYTVTSIRAGMVGL